jgi:hypothetical protein
MSTTGRIGKGVGCVAEYPCSMPTDAPSRPPTPFIVVGVVALIVCIAVARLPDSLVAQLATTRALDAAQAGWAYRILIVVAFAQAAYGGFYLFQVDRVEAARDKDTKVRALSRADLAAVVARQAAVMVVFTLLYGLAALAMTGERGGFWLFAGLALAQGAWYFRQVGVVTDWLGRQRETNLEGPSGAWSREPPDYTPPIARGLRDSQASEQPPR